MSIHKFKVAVNVNFYGNTPKSIALLPLNNRFEPHPERVPFLAENLKNEIETKAFFDVWYRIPDNKNISVITYDYPRIKPVLQDLMGSRFSKIEEPVKDILPIVGFLNDRMCYLNDGEADFPIEIKDICERLHVDAEYSEYCLVNALRYSRIYQKLILMIDTKKIYLNPLRRL